LSLEEHGAPVVEHGTAKAAKRAANVSDLGEGVGKSLTYGEQA